MNKKLIITLTVIVSALVIIVLYQVFKSDKPLKDNAAKNKNSKQYSGLIIKTSVIEAELSVSGSLLAGEQVELRNEVGGRIVRLYLPEGKFVKKGTLLVKLFDDDLQAQLRKMKAQLDLQQQLCARQEELVKVNGISRNDLEQTQYQVKALQADIAAIEAQISKTEILAPFDGVIGLRHISAGAFIQASTLLAVIRSQQELKLDFSVPEKYGARITSGMKVQFTLSENTDTYNATIIADERDIDAGTRNLRVRAIVNDKSSKLIPGAYASVKISLGTNDSALMVPTQSIIPTANGKNLIICKNGKAHFVPVQTGVRQSDSIEILSGITIGDTVLTSGMMFLKEGDPVKLTITKN